MHGFPYDIHAYAEVAPLLAAQRLPCDRARTCAAMATRASSSDCHAALGRAGRARRRPAGADGRAGHPARRARPATTGAAARPASWRRCGPSAAPGWSRFNSYNIQDIAKAMVPDTPRERAQPVVPVLLSQRARPRRPGARPARAVPAAVADCGRPPGRFDDATFERSAAAFDNPDFVDVVIQSYRHRFGLVPGDPALRRHRAPPGRAAADHRAHAHLRRHRRRRAPAGRRRRSTRTASPARARNAVVPGVGHNMPQEVPRRICRRGA